MHELSIVGKIASSVIRFAQENDLEKVVGVQIIAGRLRDFDQQFMQRYFNRFTRGTAAEGAEIKITVLPIIFKCKDCDGTFELTLRQFHDQESEGSVRCKTCDSKTLELISGTQYAIDTIEAIAKLGAERPSEEPA